MADQDREPDETAYPDLEHSNLDRVVIHNDPALASMDTVVIMSWLRLIADQNRKILQNQLLQEAQRPGSRRSSSDSAPDTSINSSDPPPTTRKAQLVIPDSGDDTPLPITRESSERPVTSSRRQISDCSQLSATSTVAQRSRLTENEPAVKEESEEGATANFPATGSNSMDLP